MSDFFGEQFETIILKIQTKHNENKNSNDSEKDTHKIRLELLERNKLEQEKKDLIGSNARKRIIQKFNLKQMLDKTINVYEELIEAKENFGN